MLSSEWCTTPWGATLAKGHVQSLEHQLRLQVPRHDPADDFAAPGIQHDGQAEEAATLNLAITNPDQQCATSLKVTGEL